MKKTISESEYFQIVGLCTLADEHVRQLRIIEESLIKLTGEEDEYGGHCGDTIYGSNTPNELLAKLEIKVLKDAKRSNR